MSSLTIAAAMAIASQCAALPPAMAPVMIGIAQHESGLDPNARHLNPNGTWDYGLAQINTVNLGWLGLTSITVMEPCANLVAGARVLFAKYNGNPPAGVKAAYSASVMSKLGAPAPQQVSVQPPSVVEQDDPNDPKPPSWDMEANALWQQRRARAATAATADQGQPAAWDMEAIALRQQGHDPAHADAEAEDAPVVVQLASKRP